jgi:hypothetical protein
VGRWRRVAVNAGYAAVWSIGIPTGGQQASGLGGDGEQGVARVACSGEASPTGTRLAVPEVSGLLSSWATLAAKVPTDAMRSR